MTSDKKPKKLNKAIRTPKTLGRNRRAHCLVCKTTQGCSRTGRLYPHTQPGTLVPCTGADSQGVRVPTLPEGT